jgi:hypothetical protein
MTDEVETVEFEELGKDAILTVAWRKQGEP